MRPHHLSRRHWVGYAPSKGLVLLSVLLVLTSSAAAQPSRAEQVERALAHVRAQQYAAALAVFRELARENSQDYEARIWVARLESWRGDFAEAEQLYRAVLAEQPSNREARLGLADVIAWQGRHAEALERLRPLYEDDATDLEVLLRLGRVSRWRGDRREALRYYREALARDPSQPEAQEAIELLIEQTDYRLEAGYLFEDFDFASETHGDFVELLHARSDRTTLLGRLGFQRKFDENLTRFSLGLTRRVGQGNYLRGEASFAPSGQVLANQDYEVELTRVLRAGVSSGLGYRYLRFRVANVHVLAPLFNWDLHPNLHLTLRYTPARTRFDSPPTSVWNHSGWARLTWDLNPTWSPYLTFAVGSENFSGVSSEQLGRFAAQTYGGGATLQWSARRGLRFGYFFQNRTDRRRQHSLGLSVFQRF